MRGSPGSIPLLFVGLAAVLWRKKAVWVCDWKEGLLVGRDQGSIGQRVGQEPQRVVLGQEEVDGWSASRS